MDSRLPVSRASLLAALEVGDWDVVLIDGRSGSGKTHLAAELSSLFPAAHVLHVEELYPGWDGLAAGAAALPRALLTRSFRPFDWVRGELQPARELPLRLPLIIEGCGAISRESLRAAAGYVDAARAAAGSAVAECAGPPRILSVWLDLATPIRKKRALARDGETYAPFWDMWAAQEEQLFARTRPQQLADFLVG